MDELAGILLNHRVELLVDVRSVPRSRHTPQFNHDTIGSDLERYGIDYRHLEQLGGLRPAAKDSANTGWRNKSFRGYADYMQADAFTSGIEELLSLARQKTAAIMCAEAVPWRCHWSMIGDALLVRGVAVIDIFDEKTSQPEKLTSFAVVDGTTIVYP